MKVALVYDRVNKWGGAERVLLTFHKIFPNAPLYTSVYNEKKAPWVKVFPKVHTSFLQKIPFAKSNHEYLAPLMPMAFESFDFTGYDLVISVTSEAAKGIITKPKTLHVCYCLTPTRYLWSGYDEYFQGGLAKTLSRSIVKALRKWDVVAAQRPDVLVSISSVVQKRVKKYYKRNSDVIYPPNSLRKTNKKGNSIKSEHFLLVSRLVPYKKVDLAISTFNKLKEKLVIVGEGKEERKLKNMAKSNIIFTGRLTDDELADYYGNTRALIMPQEEDFGLVAVEAHSYGVPVIAFGKGGARDIIEDGKTGVFFKKQTASSLLSAVKRFESMDFEKSEIMKNSIRFSESRFRKELLKLTENKI